MTAVDRKQAREGIMDRKCNTDMFTYTKMQMIIQPGGLHGTARGNIVSVEAYYATCNYQVLYRYDYSFF